jgi:hypothetical protein
MPTATIYPLLTACSELTAKVTDSREGQFRKEPWGLFLEGDGKWGQVTGKREEN